MLFQWNYNMSRITHFWCYFSGKSLHICTFPTLFNLRSGAQFGGAQSAVGQFAGGQYAGETANLAPDSEGPNFPGLRFVLSLARLTIPATPTVIDRPDLSWGKLAHL